MKSDSAALTPGESYQLPGYQFGPGANALIMMRRVAFYDEARGKLDDSGQRNLLRWAAGQGLGQEDTPSGEATFGVRSVAARRARALADLERQGQIVCRLHAVPEWRLAVGLGNKANPHEIGLSLHGTYGWPVIPGSSLKGLAAAYAIGSGADAECVRRIFGSPRHDLPALKKGKPGSDSGRGTVRFLDAMPDGRPVKVVVDVLTPHVKPYYETTRNEGSGVPVPPAEYHNPVPVNFLAVSGAFAVDLYGPDEGHLKLAAQWLTAAGNELGAGGKTGAGYGYLIITGAPEGQEQHS